MAVGKVEKIYQLRTLGYETIIKELNSVDAAFQRIRQSKQAASAKLSTAQDVAEMQKITNEIKNLRLEEARLRVERQQLTNEAKANQAARQAEILQREKVALQIKQEQLLRQQEITSRQREKVSVDAAAGSYAALYRQQRELYTLVKNAAPGTPITFQGNVLQFDQAIAKLKQLSAAEQDFRRQFTRDGLLVAEYSSGIVQAFKQMGLGDVIGGQVTKASQRLSQLNANFATLKNELLQVQATGRGSLDVIERKLIENRQEALRLQQQVGQLQQELRGTGNIGNQITSSLAQGFKDMRTQLAQFVLGYIGFQAVISGTQKLIHQNYELSDSIGQIRIYTKATTGDVNDLVDSLKKLDTRTSLRGLTDIATIVAKKGVARDEIVGVTKALDQLFVVLGKEVGDPHEAVSSLVKLVNVYSHDQHVTADNISDIGAAIAKLTSSGVATGRFLIDFAERMAGIRGITGLTIDKVLGLGAALQELGQRSEVSGTALSQLIVKLFTNTEKYAQIVGKTNAEFKKFLQDSPIDAFVLVAEKLKGNAGEMEKFFEGVTDLHVRGGRIVGVLGDIAGNAEYARKRLADASKAMGDQAALASAFAIKNETFAATLDKIAKRFEVLGSNRAVQATLLGIATAITLVLGNLPTLLAITALWATGWALLNKEMVVARAQLLLVNAQLFAGRVALAAITIVQNAYAAGVALLTGAYRGATVAATLFNTVIKASPLGIILTLIGLLASAMAVFAAKTTGTTEALKAHALQLRVNGEITEKVRSQTESVINKIDVLSKVIRDNNNSLSSRQQALKDLIDISPEYLNKLTLENLKTAEGKAILDGYIASLRKKAELQAGEAIANKAIEERTKLEKTLYDLELKRSQGKTGKNELSDEEKSFLPAYYTKIPFYSLAGAAQGMPAVDVAINRVKAAIEEKSKEVDAANDFVKSKYAKLADTVKEGNAAVPPTAIKTIQSLKDQIKSLDEQIDVAEIGSKAKARLEEARAAIQKELDAAMGKDTSTAYRGARLSGEDKDQLRIIDAARDQELALEKLKFTQGKVQEEDYLRAVLKINQDAIDAKLKLLNAGNAAEKKAVAELQLQRITDERETNEKIFQLRETALRNEFDQTKRKAEANLRAVTDNPIATETEKAQAKLDADKVILAAQQKFNAAMDALELKLSVDSKKNAEDRRIALNQIALDINKDQLSLSRSGIADIQAEGEKSIADFKASISKARAAVLEDPDASTSEKNRVSDKLDKVEAVGVLSREILALKAQLPIYQKLLDEKKITETEYYNFIQKIYDKQAALLHANEELQAVHIKTVNEMLRDGIAKALSIPSQYSAVLDRVVADTFSLAKDSMSGYFDAERARIEQSKQLMLERLDIQREQAIAHAQSKAEEDRIDKEYALKKRQEELKAGQELKKTKKAEAKIALATELANIWATVYQLGPIAGAIAGGALSLLALGRYALRINEIDSTQFEYGGNISDVPTKGGQFGGKSHSQGGTPFMFQGRTYEAEVKELAVIRTKNAPTGNFTISGNHTQIASALNVVGGGRNFAPGAAITRFENGGGLGLSLKAPVFKPASVVNTQSKADETSAIIAVLAEQARAIQSTNNRIDTLQVHLVTSNVTKAQKDEQNKKNVGVI
jgi:hypothetical protein